MATPKVNFRSQFSYSFSGQKVVISARVSIAAAGAPTLVSGTGMGIASITHNSTGDYTIALNNSAAALLDLRISHQSGNAAPAAPITNIRTNSVTSATAPLVRIQTRDLTGTLADPASGEILLLTIEVNRSSLAY